MPKNSSAGVGVPEAKYGNWVALRLIYVPGLVGGGFLALSFWSAVLVIPAALFFTVAGYFAYARFLFAPQGGNVQSSVWRTLLSHLEWDGRGRALDVGCGSGALTILLAKTYQGATVTGIDNWGKGWEYSKSLCDRNAAVEGVGARVDFQQGTASSSHSLTRPSTSSLATSRSTKSKTLPTSGCSSRRLSVFSRKAANSHSKISFC